MIPSNTDVLPVKLTNEMAQESSGELARMTSTVGAIAVTDLLKSTLGPFGMDKILLSSDGSIKVTNDGATILQSLNVDNPAAKILVDISKTTDNEVGDGTTSVCVLAGEMLREAEKLLEMRIHPQTIIEGWREGINVAKEILIKMSQDLSDNENALDKAMFDIAKTTLSSKIVKANREHFADIAVKAVKRIKGGSLGNIQIIKKIGGSSLDSYLEDGFLLEKKIGVGQPKKIENAVILVANTQMDTDKIKIFGAVVKVDSSAKVAEIEEAEKKRMITKCEKIAAHGINCFINRQLIYNLPEQFFAEKKIMAIEHADFEGVERLAEALGAEIVSTFDHPERVQLGRCKLIEEVMIGEDSVIRFSGCQKGNACTIVLRGPNMQFLDEAERSLHDALCVLNLVSKDKRIIYGGGCTEMEMSLAVDNKAKETSGKKSLSLEALARALKQLPVIIADNAGLDSADIVSQLRAAHATGLIKSGLDMINNCVGDMSKLGIVEPLRVKLHILQAAAEAAEMILRVDHILQTAPRKRERPQMGY